LEWFETTRCFITIAFNFTLDYTSRRVQVNQYVMNLNGKHQLFVHADDTTLGRSMHTIKKNTEALVVRGKETGLEVNADKMVMSRD
jgi:hypothetical protein